MHVRYRCEACAKRFSSAKNNVMQREAWILVANTLNEQLETSVAVEQRQNKVRRALSFDECVVLAAF